MSFFVKTNLWEATRAIPKLEKKISYIIYSTPTNLIKCNLHSYKHNLKKGIQLLIYYKHNPRLSWSLHLWFVQAQMVQDWLPFDELSVVVIGFVRTLGRIHRFILVLTDATAQPRPIEEPDQSAKRGNKCHGGTTQLGNKQNLHRSISTSFVQNLCSNHVATQDRERATVTQMIGAKWLRMYLLCAMQNVHSGHARRLAFIQLTLQNVWMSWPCKWKVFFITMAFARSMRLDQNRFSTETNLCCSWLKTPKTHKTICHMFLSVFFANNNMPPNQCADFSASDKSRYVQKIIIFSDKTYRNQLDYLAGNHRLYWLSTTKFLCFDENACARKTSKYPSMCMWDKDLKAFNCLRVHKCMSLAKYTSAY